MSSGGSSILLLYNVLQDELGVWDVMNRSKRENRVLLHTSHFLYIWFVHFKINLGKNAHILLKNN